MRELRCIDEKLGYTKVICAKIDEAKVQYTQVSYTVRDTTLDDKKRLYRKWKWLKDLNYVQESQDFLYCA